MEEMYEGFEIEVTDAEAFAPPFSPPNIAKMIGTLRKYIRHPSKRLVLTVRHLKERKDRRI